MFKKYFECIRSEPIFAYSTNFIDFKKHYEYENIITKRKQYCAQGSN
jgi:hypothetical protein